MKFPLISALVPEGEHFDESAIINEGGFLSVGHLTAVESSIASYKTASEQHATAIQEKTDEITSLTAKVTTLETAAENHTADAKKITEQAERIQELEAKVAELGKQSSGKGTTLETKKDEKTEEGKATVVGLNHPDHPLNKLADRRTGSKK